MILNFQTSAEYYSWKSCSTRLWCFAIPQFKFAPDSQFNLLFEVTKNTMKKCENWNSNKMACNEQSFWDLAFLGLIFRARKRYNSLRCANDVAGDFIKLKLKSSYHRLEKFWRIARLGKLSLNSGQVNNVRVHGYTRDYWQLVAVQAECCCPFASENSRSPTGWLVYLKRKSQFNSKMGKLDALIR